MSFDTPFIKSTFSYKYMYCKVKMLIAMEGVAMYAHIWYLFVEKTEQEENIQIKEYQDHIQQLREAYESQGETYQQLYLQHQEALKVWFLRQPHVSYSVLISANYKVFSTQPSW